MDKNSSSTKKKKPKIAYTIEGLPGGNILEVVYSANAWWMNRTKVYLLISAFKMGCMIVEACIHAGITTKQYKYFAQIHPEIHDIHAACEAVMVIKARQVVINLLRDEDPKAALFVLRAKRPEEYAGVPPKKQKDKYSQYNKGAMTIDEIEETNRREREKYGDASK